MCLAYSPPARATDDYGNTILHYITDNRRLVTLDRAHLSTDLTVIIIDELLYADADIDAGNVCGTTPLHEATYWGNPRIIKCLLRGGACPDVVGRVIGSPIAIVIRCVAGEDRLRDVAIGLIELFVAHGADPDIEDVDGVTALDECWESERLGAASRHADIAIRVRLVNEILRYRANRQ